MAIIMNQSLSEKVQYTRKDIQFYLKEGILSHFEYKAPAHWHIDFELICMEEGTMDYFVDGEIIHMSEGDGIFVNSTRLHYGFSEEKKDCRFLCLLFNPLVLSVTQEFAKETIYPLMEQAECPYLLLKQDIPWQKEILEEIKKLYRLPKNNLYSVQILSILYHLLSLLVENIPQETTKDSDAKNEILKNMVGYIQKNYTESLTLTAIAKAGNVCQSRCCGIFKEKLGVSPISYLNEYRLDKSISLILDTKKPISDIAYEVGFGGASYFSETFRSRYGCSPRDYRHRNKRPL